MPKTARTAAQIGALIHRERRSRGLTQAQLGQRIGRRQATISKLEKGEPATQLRTLFDVLTALNLDLTVGPRRQGSNENIQQLF
jgi:HTH-type transcriptional regulator / antitoxin HipB